MRGSPGGPGGCAPGSHAGSARPCPPQHRGALSRRPVVWKHFSPRGVDTGCLNRQLRKAIKTKGSFPNEDAARKLLYLALQNATPQWTRCRNWTTALLAFKIHFGDRVPDTAN